MIPNLSYDFWYIFMGECRLVGWLDFSYNSEFGMLSFTINFNHGDDQHWLLTWCDLESGCKQMYGCVYKVFPRSVYWIWIRSLVKLLSGLRSSRENRKEKAICALRLCTAHASLLRLCVSSSLWLLPLSLSNTMACALELWDGINPSSFKALLPGILLQQEDMKLWW